MSDKDFEKELIKRLGKRSVNISKSKRYDRVYELLMRYCHAKNLDMAPLVWETMDKYLKSQMR